MTFNQVVRGSNPRTLSFYKMKNDIIYRGNPIWGFRFLSYESFADMAELADAPDLGSGVYDVQVQVLLSALDFIPETVEQRASGVFLFRISQIGA